MYAFVTLLATTLKTALDERRVIYPAEAQLTEHSLWHYVEF